MGANSNVSPGVSLAAGSIAGAVEATMTYPFEFAKTRVQLTNQGGTKNPLRVIAQVARTDGIQSIYTGCSTLILGTALKAGVRFLCFDSIKNALQDENGRLSPGRGIVAGMGAGCAESIIAVTPTERLKTALIDDARTTKRFRGGFDATRIILQESGIGGLYKGLLSTTLKQGSTSAVRMGSYNVLKEQTRKYGIPQGSLTVFGTGAIAGIITVYATQPFDTIKTRTQSAEGASTLHAVQSIFRSSGVVGFWAGSTMRLGRLVLSGGIVFTVYEKVSSLLSFHGFSQTGIPALGR